MMKVKMKMKNTSDRYKIKRYTTVYYSVDMLFRGCIFFQSRNNFRNFYEKSEVVQQLVRQLVCTMFIANNHASFHF